MIGLVWQRRVRIAAMRLPVTNSPQSDGVGTRQITSASAKPACQLPLKRLSFPLFFADALEQVMPGDRPKGAQAHQLNRNTMPFHSR